MAARRARAGSLAQIDTIVMLMLENRSLDTMLGWAHRDGLPINIWPRGSLPACFDGIPADALNNRDGWPYPPTPGFAHLQAQQWRSPRWDPYEGLRNVQIQMYAARSSRSRALSAPDTLDHDRGSTGLAGRRLHAG